MSSTLFAQDWANLNRYKKANAALISPDQEEKRVVFMGNSITEGWSDVDPDFFSNKPYINRGISGQTTPQMLIRFRADVIELRPSVVVLLAGTNDIAGNTGPTTLDAIFNNIQSMAELARANNIKVVLSSVLPVYSYPWSPEVAAIEKIASLNDMIKHYAAQNDMIYLDYYAALVDERRGMKKEYADDGVHPTSKGYQVMGPLAKKAIEKALMKK